MYLCEDGQFDSNCTKYQKCINKLRNEGRCFAYISSIGVIDEARRLGIAGKLIEIACEHARTKDPLCHGMGLNVLCTSIPTIRCYEKHNFKKLFVDKGYYNIGNKEIDAIYMIRSFGLPAHSLNKITIKDVGEEIVRAAFAVMKISENIANWFKKN